MAKPFKKNKKNEEANSLPSHKESEMANPIEKFKKLIGTLSDDEIKAMVLAEKERKAKRLAYNKKYRKEHPLTEEQKDKRYAYNKMYRERRKLQADLLAQRAEELGLDIS